MKVTTALLAFVLPPSAHAQAANLAAAATVAGIDTPNRLACWLGQMHVESGGFRIVRENLNYTVEALLKLFSRSRISESEARAYGRVPNRQKADQRAIANCIYGREWGRKNLGNLYPEDGWKFIGRGLKQITGRYNYSVLATKMYGDDRLLDTPELLERPKEAALSAAIFWDWKNLNPLADDLKHEAITKIINGGYTALEERIEYSDTYLQRIANYRASKPDFSNVVGGVQSTEKLGK